MIEIKADLSGIETFNKFKNEFPGAVKDVIGQVAKDLRLLIRGETPIGPSHDPGISFGTAKESWGEVIEHEAGFSFGSDLVYMPVLEYGLYPGVGPVRKGDIRPRTVKTGTGIYSRQAIEGWIRKYVESEEVLEKLVNGIVAEFMKRTIS